jgi:transcriptional regulator with XRE-family HTH domain
MPRKHRFESSALRYSYDRYVGKDPKRRAVFEDAVANAEVARKIYDLRTKAGLTQAKLAELVGTSTSAISRLEDADYVGHSLGMLRRIAAAVNQRVEVRFVPVPTKPSLHRRTQRGTTAPSAKRIANRKARAGRRKPAA